MWAFVLLQAMSYFITTQATCPTCDCFKVDPFPVTLDELAKRLLFAQAFSIGHPYAGVDSGCYNFTRSSVSDVALLEETITYDNQTVRKNALVISGSDNGTIRGVGPNVSTHDFALERPCGNTYLVYQCIQKEDCPTDPSLAALLITSTQRRADQSCIQKGIETAQKYFKNVTFIECDRTVANPCDPFC